VLPCPIEEKKNTFEIAARTSLTPFTDEEIAIVEPDPEYLHQAGSSTGHGVLNFFDALIGAPPDIASQIGRSQDYGREVPCYSNVLCLTSDRG
jgi:hypothetical protein